MENSEDSDSNSGGSMSLESDALDWVNSYLKPKEFSSGLNYAELHNVLLLACIDILKNERSRVIKENIEELERSEELDDIEGYIRFDHHTVLLDGWFTLKELERILDVLRSGSLR